MSETVTVALRTGSVDLLLDDLVEMLTEGESEWVKDYRELMLNPALYHDCARRIGQDPSTLFAEAAAHGPASIANTVRLSGARTDIPSTYWPFRVQDTPDGPEYVFLNV